MESIAKQNDRNTTSTINYSREAKRIIHKILSNIHTTKVCANALVKDGIRRLNFSQRQRFKRIFNKNAPAFTHALFIPASGSGSRLFKDLIIMESTFSSKEETFSSFVNRKSLYSLIDFFKHLKDFPFYNHFKPRITEINTSSLSSDEKKNAIATLILNDTKYNFRTTPKALIPFHSYRDQEVTALAEQVDLYTSYNKKFKHNQLYFTVSDDKLALFTEELTHIIGARKEAHLSINLSPQNKNTAVYAIDNQGELVVTANGNPLRKPSGHGALLENLNEVEEQVIEIRNIDNVTTGKYRSSYIENSNVMKGYLLYCCKKIHRYLRLLEDGKLKDKQYKRLSKFLKKYFHLDLLDIVNNSPDGYHSTLYNLLNRPLRVCAMIPNQGDVGGAPYWVKSDTLGRSLQIVEKAEIDMNDTNQLQIFENSTHFNPVHMVIFKSDYKGSNFDLTQYALHQPEMLVTKTYKGKRIKFLEKPGLWNGGMHHYLTICIQAKAKTFNPVKEIVDLLKKPHQ